MKKLYLLCSFILQLLFANAQKIDFSLIQAMQTAIENGTYPNIHSVLISRNNKLLYEHYWIGKDRKDGKDLGVILHGADSLHAIQSITKTIVSACIGIALEQGKIKNIDEKIFNYFPVYSVQDTGLKAEIIIKDLLTMTPGFKWNEEDYSDPANDENQMGIASDPVAYILSRPMAFASGKVFTYNGGATQLLAAIVEKSTGKPIDVFAKEYLFTPLGITDFKWTTTTADNSTIPDAFSGLYLKSKDLLKFGLLYMNDGKYNSKQILPPHWVKKSITPYVVADDGTDPAFGRSEYGFQWWLFNDSIINKPTPIAACIGNGGQRIFVDKSNKITVVFTAGNYRKAGTYLIPYNILKEFIYPALFIKE
jgi:CubicO group peptidase (beta-lactamase class C family)